MLTDGDWLLAAAMLAVGAPLPGTAALCIATERELELVEDAPDFFSPLPGPPPGGLLTVEC